MSKGAILFVTTHSAAGGLREIWSDIAAGLAQRGHRTGCFALYPPADPQAEGVDVAAWHHLVPDKPRSAIGVLRLFFALIKYLRTHRPAAIVAAMPAANVVLPVAILAARVRTRLYISHHSPVDTHHPLLNRLDGWTGCLPSVSGIISVSNAVAASLEGKPASYRAKRVTIHNALPEPIEQLVDALARRDAVAGEGTQVIALGRLTYQKNYPMLIRAMAHSRLGRLAIVGSGEDEQALRSLAVQLGISDRIEFLGLLPRAAAIARAASADLFVQVSRYEGHSLALIEAARLGLPLIVSDVPVQVEGVTAADGSPCGEIVRLDDHVALGALIERLLADGTLRNQWATAARRLGAEMSHGAMIDRYEKLLASPEGSR